MSRRLAAVITAALLGGPLLAVAPAHAADDVTLNLIGINDFHGRIDANTVKFAGTVEQLRQDGGDANSLLISAGDNVSASLFASAAQGDIPTIDVLNALDLDASAAGNHELDKGADDLTGRLSDAADFPFLSANIFKADSSPLLEKYKIFTVAGVDVAVVGAVTEETSSLVSPGGIQGLTFTDPTEAINDTVDELDALADPPDVIVASIHEGAPYGAKTYQQNIDNSPVFKEIMENTDPEVDAIFMGHTHQAYAYDAPIPGEPIKTRPVLQTGNYGGNVGQIELTFDKASGTVTSYTKKNQARTIAADSVLTSTFPRVAAVKPIVDDALAFAAVKGNEPIGEQTADITTAFNAGGRDDRASESTLGNLVADALLSKISDSPSGADIGVVNPGGLRADLLYAGTSDTNGDGVITFAEASSVLPFFNNLSTVTLTGASFRKVLEQQWQRTADNTIPSRSYLQLGLSKNVRYTFDPARPEGSRITSISINGHPYDPAAEYKVGTFAFLGTGGDNFRAFTEGTSVDSGLVDYQAFVDYLSDNGPVSPDYARRSVQVNGVKPDYGSGASVTFSLPKLDLTSLGSQKNTSVSARLLYGAGQSRRLGSKGVTAGASAPFTFQLPAGEVGSMNIETTAFPTGTKASIPLLVKKAATVTAASTGAVFGDDATVDVTVTGSGGSSSGTVTLSKGATQLGQKTLSGADTASFTVDTEGLGAGANELTIAYSGDADFGPGSGTTTLTVAKASTSVQADDPAAAPVDETFVVGAAVDSATGTTPTGSVTVTEGADPVGTFDLAAGSGSLTVDAADLAIGGHTLTLSYGGDANHSPSTTTVDVSINKATTPLTATASPSAYGTSAVVQVAGEPGAGGLVVIGSGTDAVGMGFLINGVANVKIDKTLVPGDYDLAVHYVGSPTYEPALTTVTLTVGKAATLTSKVSISPTRLVVKKTAPLVKFSVKAAGFTVRSGSFTFMYAGTTRTVAVSSNGTATLRIPAYTSTGTKTIRGSFLGSALAKPSRASFTVTVVRR